jgi:histidinol-phosphatase
MPFSEELALVHQLANIADKISMERFLALDLAVETKPDLSPVSDADKSVELALRAAIAEAYPGDSVIGEEFANTQGSSTRSWVIDPIDGTANFVRGVPVWCTLISLMENGVSVVGMVSAPALNRRWYASQGSGAYTQFGESSPRKIAVSKVSKIEDASLSYSSFHSWKDGGKFSELAKRFWRTRAYGDFWSHMLVAEGALDVAAEPELQLFDMAALEIVVIEAGGRFTGVNGVQGSHEGNAVSSNGLLHNEVIATLK